MFNNDPVPGICIYNPETYNLEKFIEMKESNQMRMELVLHPYI